MQAKSSQSEQAPQFSLPEWAVVHPSIWTPAYRLSPDDDPDWVAYLVMHWQDNSFEFETMEDGSILFYELRVRCEDIDQFWPPADTSGEVKKPERVRQSTDIQPNSADVDETAVSRRDVCSW